MALTSGWSVVCVLPVLLTRRYNTHMRAPKSNSRGKQPEGMVESQREERMEKIDKFEEKSQVSDAPQGRGSQLSAC
jgi:hypothetical protein